MSENEKAVPWETPLELWRGFETSGPNWHGSVAGLYITSKFGQPMLSVSEVHAFADCGLEGDRFFKESWSAAHRPDKAVSLIEEEILEAAAAELGVDSFPEKTRRNIVTRGVPLRDLLGHEFMVGGVVMRGLRLFEPCAHMEKLSNIPGIFGALEHRSGLKAAIISNGVIRVNDPVALRPASQTSATAI
jgi:MOSC domain-containing protein YiiM